MNTTFGTLICAAGDIAGTTFAEDDVSEGQTT